MGERDSESLLYLLNEVAVRNGRNYDSQMQEWFILSIFQSEMYSKQPYVVSIELKKKNFNSEIDPINKHHLYQFNIFVLCVCVFPIKQIEFRFIAYLFVRYCHWASEIFFMT